MQTLAPPPPTRTRGAADVLGHLRDALTRHHAMPRARVTINDYKPDAGVLVLDDVYVWYTDGEFHWRDLRPDDQGRRRGREVVKPVAELDEVVKATAERWADLGAPAYGFCLPR
ncbi:hypothetical protein [Microbispora sp. H10670]|uniref:hypothetical protein n=1 Tax=Microbispora sp. H10670 TaxID=2729108 RepID=UPI001602645D|nr:hypothetical protein [Microbispora sp. H10670]